MDAESMRSDVALRSSEVTWTLDGSEMRGTVVVPDGAPIVAAVVMIAGSGPTDRDWNSPLLPGDNGSARLLAEALGRHGIASLRYDKRASGPNAMQTVLAMRERGGIALKTHADEAACAVRALAETSGVRGARIFALTNSEGTLHALNLQLDESARPFAGLVLTGAPGRAVGAIAHTQIAAQLAAVPGGDQILAHYDEAIARWQSGEAMNPDPSLPPGILGLLGALSAPTNQPFSQELWAADAAALIARVDVPVLVVIGKKDIQCDWQLDGGALERAAAGRDVQFAYPENANHILKHEPRPRESLAAAEVGMRYNAPGETLDAETVTIIVEWLLTHAG